MKLQSTVLTWVCYSLATNKALHILLLCTCLSKGDKGAQSNLKKGEVCVKQAYIEICIHSQHKWEYFYIDYIIYTSIFYLMCSCNFLKVRNISYWANWKPPMHKAIVHKHVCDTKHSDAQALQKSKTWRNTVSSSQHFLAQGNGIIAEAYVVTYSSKT